MDTTPIGKLGAEAMDTLAEHYGEDAHVRTAALLLEIDVGESCEFVVLASDDRPWVQEAFLHESLCKLEDRTNALREDD